MATVGKRIEKDRENKVGHRVICKENDPTPGTRFSLIKLRIALINPLSTQASNIPMLAYRRVRECFRVLDVTVPRRVSKPANDEWEQETQGSGSGRQRTALNPPVSSGMQCSGDKIIRAPLRGDYGKHWQGRGELTIGRL